MKTQKPIGSSILAKIKRQFPDVTEVVDSKESITISVTQRDATGATKKDPNSCAMAKAVCRQEHLDGAIIGLTKSYLIKGKKAVRYSTPVTVAREITSFDRHHDFREGTDYRLSRVSNCERIGSWKTRSESYKQSGHKHVELQYTHQHHTSDIRTRKQPKR